MAEHPDAPVNPLSAPRAASRAHLKIFDVAKTIAIISVVFEHSFMQQYIQDESGNKAPSHAIFMYLFLFLGFYVMQALFISSGYLFVHTRGYERAGGYFRFLARKAKRLLVPYAALTTAAFLAKGLFGRYASRPIPFTWAEYVDSLLYPTCGPILLAWFLPALMGIFLFAPLLRKGLTMPVWAWAAMTAVWAAFYFANLTKGFPLAEFLEQRGLLEQAPFRWLYKLSVNDSGKSGYHAMLAFSSMFSYMLYFWLGILAFRYQAAWRGLLRNRSLRTAALIANVTAVIFWANNIGQERLYEKLTILMGPTGAVVVFGFAAWYVRHNVRFLDGVTRYSYSIYLTSWFFQQALFVVTRRIFPEMTLSLDGRLLVSMTLLFAGGVLGPTILAHFATKWRVPGRFLIGA